MTNVRRLQYRMAFHARVPLPYGVRSTGYYEATPGIEIDNSTPKPFVQLYWGLAGWGTFKHKKSSLRVGANQLFAYPHGSAHLIHAGSELFKYYWVTFDGPLAGLVVAAFGLTEPWPREVGAPPAGLFQRLAELLKNESLKAERLAAATAFELLLAASAGALPSAPPAGADSVVEASRARLLAHLSDADFGVKVLARELGLHRSYLSRKFHKLAGLSPKNYLTSLRLHRAMALLKETDLPIREIARQTGFADANYFTRAFHRKLGVSPQHFRKY